MSTSLSSLNISRPKDFSLSCLPMISRPKDKKSSRIVGDCLSSLETSRNVHRVIGPPAQLLVLAQTGYDRHLGLGCCSFFTEFQLLGKQAPASIGKLRMTCTPPYARRPTLRRSWPQPT
ncbi:hypothetical protein SNK03_007206 [Fusarium graminearum]